MFVCGYADVSYNICEYEISNIGVDVDDDAEDVSVTSRADMIDETDVTYVTETIIDLSAIDEHVTVVFQT